MRWAISWSEESLDDLDRLDRRIHARVLRAVERYADTGHGDVKRLKGTKEFRLRVGDWRVRFQPDPESDTILILRVLSRGRAYR